MPHDLPPLDLNVVPLGVGTHVVFLTLLEPVDGAMVRIPRLGHYARRSAVVLSR
jgi:hypothetical protein